MMKKKGIIVFGIMVLAVVAMKLFSDMVYFETTSQYSQSAFYEHFHIQPQAKDAKLEPYFEHKKFSNPYTLFFKQTPVYEQRYIWHETKDKEYSVVVNASDNKDSYQTIQKAGDLLKTYDLSIKNMNVKLEMIQSDLLDYPVYHYYMTFHFKDKQYAIIVYGIEKKEMNLHAELTNEMKTSLTNLINEVLI